MNIVHVEKEDATAVFDHQSLEMARTGLQLFEQCKDVTISFACLVQLYLLLDSLPRSVKSLPVERLEQVVESVYLKGTHGILIVGSNKDDVRS